MVQFTSVILGMCACRVVCVKVAVLRRGCSCCGRKYDSFIEWAADDPHVYIGRRVAYVAGTTDTKWMNPYAVGKSRTREESIALYEKYLKSRPDLVSDINAELRGKTLGCWCAPLPCHGDSLIRCLSSSGNLDSKKHA